MNAPLTAELSPHNFSPSLQRIRNWFHFYFGTRILDQKPNALDHFKCKNYCKKDSDRNKVFSFLFHFFYLTYFCF